MNDLRKEAVVMLKSNGDEVCRIDYHIPASAGEEFYCNDDRYVIDAVQWHRDDSIRKLWQYVIVKTPRTGRKAS